MTTSELFSFRIDFFLVKIKSISFYVVSGMDWVDWDLGLLYWHWVGDHSPEAEVKWFVKSPWRQVKILRYWLFVKHWNFSTNKEFSHPDFFSSYKLWNITIWNFCKWRKFDIYIEMFMRKNKSFEWKNLVFLSFIVGFFNYYTFWG